MNHERGKGRGLARPSTFYNHQVTQGRKNMQKAEVAPFLFRDRHIPSLDVSRGSTPLPLNSDCGQSGRSSLPLTDFLVAV